MSDKQRLNNLQALKEIGQRMSDKQRLSKLQALQEIGRHFDLIAKAYQADRSRCQAFTQAAQMVREYLPADKRKCV